MKYLVLHTGNQLFCYVIQYMIRKVFVSAQRFAAIQRTDILTDVAAPDDVVLAQCIPLGLCLRFFFLNIRKTFFKFITVSAYRTAGTSLHTSAAIDAISRL